MVCISGVKYHLKLRKRIMSKFNKLAALSQIAEQLEKAGHSTEAALVHNQFMKLAQKGDEMPLNEIATKEMSDELLSENMEPETTAMGFKEMLESYAPTFLKLCRVYPKRIKGFLVPPYSSEAIYDNIKFVQELLLASPYVKDKKGLQANGTFGPNTMRIMDDLRKLLNKILFDGYAAKFNIKDDAGNILKIEKADKFF